MFCILIGVLSFVVVSRCLLIFGSSFSLAALRTTASVGRVIKLLNFNVMKMYTVPFLKQERTEDVTAKIHRE